MSNVHKNNWHADGWHSDEHHSEGWHSDDNELALHELDSVAGGAEMSEDDRAIFNMLKGALRRAVQKRCTEKGITFSEEMYAGLEQELEDGIAALSDADYAAAKAVFEAVVSHIG